MTPSPFMAAVREADGVPHLVSVARSGTVQAQEHAATVLAHLARDRENQRELRSEGAISALVKLLAQGSPVAQQEAACALQRLASQDARVRQNINSAGGVEQLVRLLRPGPVVEVQQAAAAALAVLAAERQCRDKMHGFGAVPLLVGMMASPNPCSQEQAAGVLAGVSRAEQQEDAREGAAGDAAEQLSRQRDLAESISRLEALQAQPGVRARLSGGARLQTAIDARRAQLAELEPELPPSSLPRRAPPGAAPAATAAGAASGERSPPTADKPAQPAKRRRTDPSPQPAATPAAPTPETQAAAPMGQAAAPSADRGKAPGRAAATPKRGQTTPRNDQSGGQRDGAVKAEEELGPSPSQRLTRQNLRGGPGGVPSCVQQLASDDRVRKHAALEKLLDFSGRDKLQRVAICEADGVPRLAKIVRDGDDELKVLAVRVLQHLAGDEAGRLLIGSCEALHPHLLPLTKLLSARPDDLKMAALGALVALVRNAKNAARLLGRPAAVEQLAAMLRSRHQQAREDAQEALLLILGHMRDHFGDHFVDPVSLLVPLIREGVPDVQEQAAQWLSVMVGKPGAAQALCQAGGVELIRELQDKCTAKAYPYLAKMLMGRHLWDPASEDDSSGSEGSAGEGPSEVAPRLDIPAAVQALSPDTNFEAVLDKLLEAVDLGGEAEKVAMRAAGVLPRLAKLLRPAGGAVPEGAVSKAVELLSHVIWDDARDAPDAAAVKKAVAAGVVPPLLGLLQLDNWEVVAPLGSLAAASEQAREVIVDAREVVSMVVASLVDTRCQKQVEDGFALELLSGLALEWRARGVLRDDERLQARVEALAAEGEAKEQKYAGLLLKRLADVGSH